MFKSIAASLRLPLAMALLLTLLAGVNTASAQQSQKKYYPGGSIKAEVPVVNGIKQGIGKSYFEDGKPYYVVQFANGQAATIKIYNQEGQLEFERQGANGKFISYDFRGEKRVIDGTSALDSSLTAAIMDEVAEFFGK